MKFIKGAFILSIFFVACNQNTGAGGSSVSDEQSQVSEANKAAIVKEKLPPAAYVGWVEDKSHGLNKEKTIGDIIYSAQYKPCQYIICEEERKQSLADTLVKRDLKQLSGLQYFTLRIALKDGQGELLKYGLTSNSDYADRMNYFSFGMQKDIQLVEGKDTLPCVLFHYERVYDVAPYGTFVLAFSLGKNPDADRTLLLFDKGFNKGIIKFFFIGKDIQYIPQLETT